MREFNKHAGALLHGSERKDADAINALIIGEGDKIEGTSKSIKSDLKILKKMVLIKDALNTFNVRPAWDEREEWNTQEEMERKILGREAYERQFRTFEVMVEEKHWEIVVQKEDMQHLKELVEWGL